MKKNKLYGRVIKVVDGNTFEMSIHEPKNLLSNDIHRIEKVRIHGMNKPAASTFSGILAKLELEKMIAGHKLECEIIDTDDNDQLIVVIPQKYLPTSFNFPTHSKF